MSDMKSGENRIDVLFVVNEPGEFVELHRFAEFFLKKQSARCAFLFTSPSFKNLRRDSFHCRRIGAQVFHPGKAIPARIDDECQSVDPLDNGYTPLSLASKDDAKETGALGWSLLALLAPLFLAELFIKRLRRPIGGSFRRTSRIRTFSYAHEVYKRTRPGVIVFGQEFPGSVNSWLTKLSKRDGTKTLILPFAVGTTKEMCESLYTIPGFDANANLLNRFCARFFPHWVNYYKGKKLLRLPGVEVIAIELAGIAPLHPWLPNWSSVDLLAVESKEMLHYYRKYGFPDQQLVLTGSMNDDILAGLQSKNEELRRRITKTLGLDEYRRVAVVALPPDQFSSRKIPLEFGNYEELCRAWADALSVLQKSDSFNVIIRPHPVTDKKMLKDIFEQRDMIVTNLDTVELVSICDLFVASVSSTIRWAIASGKPVVNYDVYDYGYSDFDSAKGVVTISHFRLFQGALIGFVFGHEKLIELEEKQKSCAKDWGCIDGQSGERIATQVIAMLEGGNKC